MPDLLIRGVDAGAVRRLKELAVEHKRSLQAESRMILEGVASPRRRDVMAAVMKVRRLFSGRRFSDSTKLVREGRNR